MTYNLRIPLYDIGTLIAGFYMGYNEGKGIDVSQTTEYLTKYGPTVFALVYTPAILKFSNIIKKKITTKTKEGLKNNNLIVHMKDGTSKRYADLNKTEKEEITSKINNSMDTIDSKVINQKYFEPTIKAGTKTAIESIIGYAAGRLYSQFN